MPTFRVNLMKNRPVPLPQRRLTASMLVLYILVSGSLLVWVCHQAARDVQAARCQARLIEAQCRAFQARHAGWQSLTAYAGDLRQQLGRTEVALNATERLLRQRLSVAHILRDLAVALPRDMWLLNIDINAAASALKFDLAVPVDAPGGETNTAAILTAWRDAPFLKRGVADLREQSSRQTELSGKAAFLLHFEAVLREGL